MSRRRMLQSIPLQNIIGDLSECLRNDIMPFVIDNEHKMYYYRGLSEFATTPGFLIGTIQSSQDTYEAWIKYFNKDLLEGLKME